MKNFLEQTSLVFTLFLSSLLLGCSQDDSGKVEEYKNEETSRKWILKWSEEFNYEGVPDSSIWSMEEGFRRNREEQYYTSNIENAEVKDGHLVIKAIKESIPNASYDADDTLWKKSWKTGEYTSASIHTRGKFEATYGRFEVSAKLPSGRGVWPAIWLLGSNVTQVGWPDCGELDIMEFVGWDPGKVHANVHTKAFNHAIGTNKGDSIMIENFDTEFHTYAMDWYKDSIEFFVDDQSYFTFNKVASDSFEVWPYDKPQYVILNLAIGGMWGGRHGIDSTIFPQEYLIDYVRYYELNDND